MTSKSKFILNSVLDTERQKGLERLISEALETSRATSGNTKVEKMAGTICKRCNKPTIEEKTGIRTDGSVIIREIHDDYRSFCEVEMVGGGLL